MFGLCEGLAGRAGAYRWERRLAPVCEVRGLLAGQRCQRDPDVRPVRRAALLILCVLASLAQTGDGKPRVSASICENRDCVKRAQVGFEPALIGVTYTVPIRKENRAIRFGLACTTSGPHDSERSIDGDQERVPQFIVNYYRIPAGECVAVLIVVKADGSYTTAKSEKVIVLDRD